jgi:hypothetical protein
MLSPLIQSEHYHTNNNNNNNNKYAYADINDHRTYYRTGPCNNGHEHDEHNLAGTALDMAQLLAKVASGRLLTAGWMKWTVGMFADQHHAPSRIPGGVPPGVKGINMSIIIYAVTQK